MWIGAGDTLLQVSSATLWKKLRKAGRDGGTIGADWDPTPMQIPLFATRNCWHLFKGPNLAPIYSQGSLTATRRATGAALTAAAQS